MHVGNSAKSNWSHVRRKAAMLHTVGSAEGLAALSIASAFDAHEIAVNLRNRPYFRLNIPLNADRTKMASCGAD
ncbi:hypothetical protein HYPGJ_31965 [Hyphomicrobium sp. GJ21]|nr:hypothetical protein HYPGJ_31965 [Hyphomicrobium sp. GJ21]